MTNLPEKADDAATLYLGSDRYPYTVIARSKTGHKITLREDKATRIDSNGQSESQTYEYHPDPAGQVVVAYRDIRGQYHVKHSLVGLGSRVKYLDPSF